MATLPSPSDSDAIRKAFRLMTWALACHAVTIGATLLLPMEFGRLLVAILWGAVMTMSVTGTFILLIGCCSALALRL